MTEEEARIDLLKAQKRLADLQIEAHEKSTMRGGPARVTGGCACWRGQLCDFHNKMYHGNKA